MYSKHEKALSKKMDAFISWSPLIKQAKHWFGI
jgi:hypothetical protein